MGWTKSSKRGKVIRGKANENHSVTWFTSARRARIKTSMTANAGKEAEETDISSRANGDGERCSQSLAVPDKAKHAVIMQSAFIGHTSAKSLPAKAGGARDAGSIQGREDPLEE